MYNTKWQRTVSRRKKKKPPSKRSRKKRLTNLDPHAWPVNSTQPFVVLRPPFPRQQGPSGLSGQQETITSHVPVGLPRHRPPALQLPYTNYPVRQMAPMWSMHTPMPPPLVRCPVAKIRTKEGALSQSDPLRLKSVCNHEQVRANEGAISQSNLPPLQSVRDDKQEQVRTDKVVVPVSGPLSSDGSNDHDQAIAHPASFPCGSTASSFQSLPVSNSFEMPQPMAIRAQQNCVTSSVSTQEMDHPVLTIAFPNDEEVEFSSLRPEHLKMLQRGRKRAHYCHGDQNRRDC